MLPNHVCELPELMLVISAGHNLWKLTLTLILSNSWKNEGLLSLSLIKQVWDMALKPIIE